MFHTHHYLHTLVMVVLLLTSISLGCFSPNTTVENTSTQGVQPIKPKVEVVQKVAIDTSRISPPVAKKIEKSSVKKVKPIAPRKKPVIKRSYSAVHFEETVFDFGDIVVGEVVKHRFLFKNTGKKPLDIFRTETSCGCTVGSFPFIPIDLNEKAFIDVQFDSKDKLGVQEATISVISNAKNSPSILTIKGRVLTESLSPLAVDSTKSGK